MALRKGFFMAVTTITSTGYATDSSANYGIWHFTIVLMLMFIGGSAGSTSGGMKVARIVLILKMVYAQTRISFRPSVVHVIRMSGKAVKSECHCGSRCLFRGVHCDHRARNSRDNHSGGCECSHGIWCRIYLRRKYGSLSSLRVRTILRPILKVVNSSFHYLWFVDSNSSPCSPCFCKTFWRR